MKINKVDIAYIAGYVDGEGHIKHTHPKYKRKDMHEVIYSYPRIEITSVDKKPLLFCKAIYGGNIHAYRPKKESHKVQYRYEVSGKNAMNMLKAIFPYLLIKKQRVAEMLTYYEHTKYEMLPSGDYHLTKKRGGK